MLLEFHRTHPTKIKTLPATSDTQLSIKQILDTDPEINFIPWELNIQDVAATKARNLHPRGLLSLVLNQHQWDTHALNTSIVDGQAVIANRFVLPNYQEVSEEMNASQITVARIRNKVRDDWMSAEQQLKLAVMDSVGDTIRHIIAPPPIDHFRHNRSRPFHLWQNDTPYDQKSEGNLDRKTRQRAQLAYTLR